METLQQIGIFDKDRKFVAYKYSHALVPLGILVFYVVIYHILSFTLIVPKLAFAETADRFRRRSAANFWRLANYMLKLNCVKIEITGDELEVDSAVLLSNHRSIADYIVISALAQSLEDKGRPEIDLVSVKFFSWFSLWGLPNLNVFNNILSCDENWELDTSTTYNTFNPSVVSTKPEWISVFPEVNIWSAENNELLNELNEKYYLPKLQNVLYPRFSSTFNVINGLYKSSFSKLYDITILYYKKKAADPQKIVKMSQTETAIQLESSGEPDEMVRTTLFDSPSLLQVLGEYPSSFVVRVHVKLKALPRIPLKRKKLEKWLEKEWVEKDKLLEQLQTTILTNHLKEK
ncbi:hypothetical protein PP7435_CHR4-0245 [Komagataella phaffii CBS 7435]|nr:GQ67_05098T0 [Komagataella phaffii]AOA69481.1 GQ68_05080T0 [Komagataella phaffii GS115]CAH2450618.1 hypothetical protein BQ9382_C4-1295 [Komagataella phaffii CBS 7435]CCA40420.1 hypothetical protein PP7435_CHR4-0245 [Komagataella phaffii CBS 7435]